MVAAASANAQDAADEGEAARSGALADEVLVVTARKREESLNEIPESVTALSGADIDRQQIKGLEDIGFQVPNLNLSTRLDGFPNVTVRGLGSFGNTQGVGFYLDDVQLFSDASSRFGDLQRIEILKGPQGTLYGGSNIGGAIKFVSVRPDSEAFSGRAKAVAGEQGVLDFEASVNAPFGNGWAARLFGFTVSNDGYLTNPNSARANGERASNDPDIGASEESGVRVSLAGPLGERLSAYASLRWNEFDGPNNTWVRELDKSLGHPNVVDTSTNPRHVRDTVSMMLELTLEMDGFDVISVTSSTDTDSERYSDLDIKHEMLLDLIRPETMEVLTQELRLASTGDGPAQWLAGVYYSRYDERMDSDLIWFDTRAVGDGFDGPLGCALGLDTCNGVWAGEQPTPAEERQTVRTPFEKRNRDKSHFAAFGNLTYDAGDWEFGVGLRLDQWSNDTENFDTRLSSSKDGSVVLPRLSATRWLNDESMLYATVARGFEPGGYNLANFEGETELHGFDPEEATSFEAGWKRRSADGRTSLALAVFTIDYESRQVEYQATNDTGGVVEGIVNIGDSSQTGVEAEARLRLTDALQVALGIGVTNAEWKSGTKVGDADLGGKTPPVTPDLSWNLGADYRRPLNAGLDLIAAVQVSHNGSYEGLQAWDTVTNPEFTLVGGQIGLAATRWEAMLNAENLLDESYYTDMQHFPNFYLLDGGDNVVIGTLGQPRLFTASFSVYF